MPSGTDHTRTCTLSDLGLQARGGRDPLIGGLAIDSREVSRGTLFAAFPGAKVHGAAFAQSAIDSGAAAILTDPAGLAMLGSAAASGDVALVVTEDPRADFARAAAIWFGAQPATVVAVTGTNGKTSVATFCRQLWDAMGETACNLGTTGVEGAWTHPLKHTTPDPLTLHRALAQAAGQGVTHLAMEASSHGLDQRRLDGVVIKAAGFTNFTQDHLDYHQTFDAYFAAKMGLFDRVLPADGVAVVNIDDPKGPEVAARAGANGARVITVGQAKDADLRLLGQRFDATGQDIRFSFAGQAHTARLSLIGGFQAANAMLAAGLVIAGGAKAGDVFAALPMLGTVRGRMQLAATRSNGAAVYVDYAHTPDAVETALRALRPHVLGRIIAIVGAGGDRDRGKRPLMGAAAARNADVVIVSDDNPRSENPAEIRKAVIAGVEAAGFGAADVGDRAEAILRGVAALEPGDALLIAGKGHETGQTIGDQILPFDDVEQASIAVAAIDGALA